MAPTVESFFRSFGTNLEAPVRQHLRNVYACLTMSTISAAAGAYVHMFTQWMSGGLLTVLASTALIVLLLSTPDTGKNRQLRLSYLLGFAFFSGMGMGPLLDMVVRVNPSIIVTALMSTAVVFVSFSASALLAARGSWLYLGGTLMTMLTSMLMFSLMNIFFQSYILYQAHVYLGLLLMCGFVLYDTQLIMEKRRLGDKDFVAHSLDLFIDLIGMFRRLLIILTDKEQQKKNRRE
ncbi:putative Bax inhibitor 1 [Frankliniella fusca]|uniref:Bax inhibitor 1 n=2 Tax=Arthropoda TaxID=6656 RepID=A0AAE1I634_9NEOP|nr:putative Bax inhibitor 1 [Frankliniella fusca]